MRYNELMWRRQRNEALLEETTLQAEISCKYLGPLGNDYHFTPISLQRFALGLDPFHHLVDLDL